MKATLGILGLTALAGFSAGCASTADLVDPPRVALRNVELTDIAMSGQTFVLDFDVTNPNPFPLPVRRVRYGVELDGMRFASGETTGAFTVPAESDGAFAISVDVDLLRTAPQLMFIVREGVQREIPYTLKGRFEIDLPLIAPVDFSSSGTIRLQAAAF